MRPSIATKGIYRIFFYFGDLRLGQFCGLPIIRQWEKNQIPPARIRSGNFIMKWVMLSLFMIQGKILVGDLHIGHLESDDVIRGRQQVFANNSRLKKVEIRSWFHCVRLVKMHRLTCNMTYLGQHVTSRDLGLMLNFDLTFQRHQVHFLTRLDERNRMLLEWRITFLVQKLFTKKTFFAKKGYYGVFGHLAAKPLSAEIWGHVYERTSQELSNAFSPSST